MIRLIPKYDRFLPLPVLLSVPKVVKGLIDAVNYLNLGHVFVAKITGNVVFLSFAIANAKKY